MLCLPSGHGKRSLSFATKRFIRQKPVPYVYQLEVSQEQYAYRLGKPREREQSWTAKIDNRKKIAKIDNTSTSPHANAQEVQLPKQTDRGACFLYVEQASHEEEGTGHTTCPLPPFHRCALTMQFFFGWCYSYGPQQGPDRQQKKEERGLKQRRKQKEAAQGDPEPGKGNQEKEKDLSRVQS